MPDDYLTLDKLCSGDRPSILAAGMLVANALKKDPCALIAVNALGHVILRHPATYSVLVPPLVQDETLDQLTEDEAILVMAREDRSEVDILDYLKRRIARAGAPDAK